MRGKGTAFRSTSLAFVKVVLCRCEGLILDVVFPTLQAASLPGEDGGQSEAQAAEGHGPTPQRDGQDHAGIVSAAVCAYKNSTWQHSIKHTPCVSVHLSIDAAGLPTLPDFTTRNGLTILFHCTKVINPSGIRAAPFKKNQNTLLLHSC